MSDQYPRIVSFIREQPWALRPETMAAMLDLIRFRHEGGRLTGEDIRARVGSKPARHDVTLTEDGVVGLGLMDHEIEAAGSWQAAAAERGQPPKGTVVAILPIMGVISHRAPMMEDMSGPGGTSVDRLTARFRSAMADQQVRAVVFDVDSPGGGVYGVQELGDEIREARGQKPVVAVANSQAASAAFWLATQADELVVTPSGEVGSVGVFSAHEDISKALEAQGVKVTLVSAGKFKTEGNPFEPLTEEARDSVQARVDDYYASFVRAVSKGRSREDRKVSPEDVRKGYGQGRMVGAAQAVEQGMADRVATLDETVRRLAGRRGSASPAAEAPKPNLSAQAEREAAAARLRLL